MITYRPHGSFTTSDGATIGFTLHGARTTSAPRLVLIHSLALDRSVWDGVVTQLRGDVAMLVYDCRGHGRSSRQPGTFTAESFANDLSQLLDHVEWDRATIAGCSMGGCVAQAFAGLFPARVEALGLIDTTAWYGEEASKQFRERAAAARAKGMAGLIDFQLTRWFSDTFRADQPKLAQAPTRVFLANDFDCYAASCALLGDADLRRYLPTLRVPVAIVVGEEDFATPVAMAKHLHETIPKSTLQVLAGARHLTPIESPERVAGELRLLLNRAHG